MKKIKLVVIFSDEASDTDINLLLEDVEETELTEITRFDDNAKMVVEVNSKIPDPDYSGSLIEYWSAVLNDSKCPCCHPLEETDLAVYEVITLKDFIKKDTTNTYPWLQELL